MSKTKLTPAQKACRTSVAIIEAKIAEAAITVGIEVETSNGNLYIGARGMKYAPTISIMIDKSTYKTIYIGPKDVWTKIAFVPDSVGFVESMHFNPYTKANASLWVEIDTYDFTELMRDIKKRFEAKPEKDGPPPF